MMRPRNFQIPHFLCAGMLLGIWATNSPAQIPGYSPADTKTASQQSSTNSLASPPSINSTAQPTVALQPQRAPGYQQPLAAQSAASSTLPDDAWKGGRNGSPTGLRPTNGHSPSQPQVVGQSGSNGAAERTFQQFGNAATKPNTDGVVTASYESQKTRSRTVLQPKSETDDPSKTKAKGGTVQVLVSIFTSLVVVIGLILGVALLYRKSLAATMGKGLPKNVVQVLGRTTIAPRQQLVVVRFGSKLVLVSMLQGEARALSEITDPLEVDQLAGFCESSQSGSVAASFREILTQGAKG